MREARNPTAIWAIITLLALFSYGAWQVMVAPLSTGSAYPDYSSLRSDPLGSKALFDSLARLADVTVTRGFKDPAPPNRETTLLFLGLAADEIEAWPTSELKQYEGLLKNGGRLVLAFEPAQKPDEPQAAKGQPRATKAEPRIPAIERQWNLKAQFASPSEEEDKNAEKDERQTALYFAAGPEWSVLLSNENGSTIVERPLAGGTIVFVANGFIFSNQSLSEEAETDLIADVLGNPGSIVFDETHLGVAESGSVAVLGRKYHLEPALAALLIAAILFVWRGSSNFLPVQQNEAADVLEGRDSHTGLAALLRRSVPPAKLIDACLNEWRRTARAGADAKLVVALTGSTTDPVETYRKASRALKEKHD